MRRRGDETKRIGKRKRGAKKDKRNKFHVNGFAAGRDARLASPARLDALATPRLLLYLLQTSLKR